MRAAAAERLLEVQARGLIPDSYRQIVDPLGELMSTVSEAVAFKDNVAALVNTLQDRIRYKHTTSAEQTRAEVLVYERALERVGRLLVDITRLGIEDRMARIQQAQAAALVALIDAVIRDLGHDPQDPDVAAIVATRVAAIEAGGP